MTGGAAHKVKGTRRERDVVHMLVADGWLAFRSMGSLGPADVIAMRAGSTPMLIQIKAGVLASLWNRFPPAERSALSVAARRAGADAVACFWRDREPCPRFIFEADWPALSRRGTPDYIVEPVTGCWIWLKALHPEGYGTAHRDGRTWLAHRFYYTKAKGEIPAGLQLDHLCRVRACVNPDHLEAVTQQTNIQRSPVTRLTADDVRAIRADVRPSSEVARDFGITRGWVYHLRKRNKRTDVPETDWPRARAA